MMMMISAILLAITVLPAVQVQTISVPNGYSLIRNRFAYMADTASIENFASKCLIPISRQPKPLSQSMETLIDYIERLEEFLANTTDPILSKIKSVPDVARLILHRFHLDDIDFQYMTIPLLVKARAEIDTQILGRSKLVENEYYFPDSIYNEDELCSMLFMFSHFILNTSQPNRYRRDTYNFPHAGGSDTFAPVQPQPLQEKGVVSLRQNPNEAIAPARVLIGVLAGMTKNFVLNGKDILNKLGTPFDQSAVLKDPIMAVTLANLGGVAVFHESGTNNKFSEQLVFGVTGQWMDETCCTYYAISGEVQEEVLQFSNRGSLAQIRGSIDGYLIGRALQKVDASQSLRLSTILRSYYSVPHSSTGTDNGLTVSYCDRQNLRPNSNDMNNEAQTYSLIYRAYSSATGSVKLNEFSGAVDRAASPAVTDMCHERPLGSLDKNSPCETPSDLLFMVDPKRENLNKTAKAITSIISKMNRIGKYAGTVSVFVNSNGKSSTVTNLPGSSWPLGALIFNSTNIGSVSCSFKQEGFNFAPLTSMGQFFRQLNQTIMNYKWWTPRRFMVGTPSTTVIIIDYDTLKPPNNDKDRWDYDTFKDQLKWDNRDVRYLVMSNNQKDFDDILQEKSTDLVSATQTQPGTNWAKRICENPAKLIYNDCAVKPSENVVHSAFVSPGYKQNWAMYPEHFHRSFNIEFKVKAEDGAIRYCWERKFPPEFYCKDLAMGSEDAFYVDNPCHHQSVHSCVPIYITVWGKEKTTPCTDVACQTLDQIKFSITHKGVSCNSSIKLGSAIILQIVCFLIAYFNYKNFF